MFSVSNGRVQSLSSSSQLSPPSLPMTATVSEPDTFKVQLKSILTNVPWILFTLAAVPEAFVYSGLVTFGAKFFQLSLGMTSSEAAVTFASVIVLGTRFMVFKLEKGSFRCFTFRSYANFNGTI